MKCHQGAALGTVKLGKEVYSESCFVVVIYISNKAKPQENFGLWGVFASWWMQSMDVLY